MTVVGQAEQVLHFERNALGIASVLMSSWTAAHRDIGRWFPLPSFSRTVSQNSRPHTFRKIRLWYIIHTGTKQTAVKLTE